MVGPWHHHFMRNSSQRDSWHVHLLVFETEASCLPVLASCPDRSYRECLLSRAGSSHADLINLAHTRFFWKCSSVFKFEGCGMQTQTSGSFWACGGLGVQLHGCFIRVASPGQAWPLLVARGPTCFCWPLIPEPASTAVYFHSCTVFYCDSLFLKGEKIKPFPLTSLSWSLSFITSSLSEFRILIQATV